VAVDLSEKAAWVAGMGSQPSPTILDEEGAYYLAAAYYGWSLAIDLDPASQVLASASCSTDIQDCP
jgi:hypothetical protein